MTDETKRLGEVHTYSDTLNALELATADRRFEQLLERRDRLVERSRFGILALNGASIVGVLSNVERLQKAFGLDITLSLSLFAGGMILAVMSIFFETNFVGARAAQMSGHLSMLRDMRATLDSEYSIENEDRLLEHSEAVKSRLERISATKIDLDFEKQAFPNDFSFSLWALITLNFGAGMWLAGILTFISEFYGR